MIFVLKGDTISSTVIEQWISRELITCILVRLIESSYNIPLTTFNIITAAGNFQSRKLFGNRRTS